MMIHKFGETLMKYGGWKYGLNHSLKKMGRIIYPLSWNFRDTLTRLINSLHQSLIAPWTNHLNFRSQVGMERRDVILTAVFGTVGAVAVLVGLGLAAWLYLRARRSKQRDGDLEEQPENGAGSSQPQQPVKKNGLLNLKTPLISTKALGWVVDRFLFRYI